MDVTSRNYGLRVSGNSGRFVGTCLSDVPLGRIPVELVADRKGRRDPTYALHGHSLVGPSRSREPLDAVGHEKIPVGDHAGDTAVMADAADDLFEIRMEERLTATDHDQRGAEFGQMIDAAEHDSDVDRL